MDFLQNSGFIKYLFENLKTMHSTIYTNDTKAWYVTTLSQRWECNVYILSCAKSSQCNDARNVNEHSCTIGIF